MTNPFVEIGDDASLNRFLAESNGGPAIIYKHSNTCGISERAYSEMSRLTRPVGMVTVQTARALSQAIETRFNVEHESPQVLILRDGKVVWTASHGQIRADAVEAAAQTAGESSPQ
jgi:bacillithiol system protein YtxJ